MQDLFWRRFLAIAGIHFIDQNCLDRESSAMFYFFMKLIHPASAIRRCFAIQTKKALPSLLAGLMHLAVVQHAAAQATALIVIRDQ